MFVSENLKDVDQIEVIVLMDNLSDPFSVSHPGMKFNEFQYQFGVRACRQDSGANLCRACLGLSLLIRLKSADEVFSVLFDTGPDDGLAVENARRLGVDLQEVDAVVLSHGHSDHISGIGTCLKAIGKEVPVYYHPDVFVPRASRFGEDELIISPIIKEEDLKAAAADLTKVKDPKLLFGNRVLLSGEIPRKTSYETGVPGEMNFENGEWVPAPLIMDEQCIIIKLKGKGTCVFTGCGHPGVVNTLNYAHKLTGEDPHFIMGGFHLAGPTFERRISDTIRDLKKLAPDYLISGHCTGFKAQSALTSHFGDAHIPYGVASVLRFRGARVAISRSPHAGAQEG